MATQTTSLPDGSTLTKPEYTDPANIAEINSNMDKIVNNINKGNTDVVQLSDGLAIVANGNTHAAISSGQFVYVKGHDTLPEGLYKATSAIAANGTLSTSNLTSDGVGGLNDLQGQLTTLNSNLNPQGYTTSGLTAVGCTFDRGGYCKVGKIVIINIRLIINSTAYVAGFPRPFNIVGFAGYDGLNEKAALGYLDTTGALRIPSAYGTNGTLSFSFVYITSD